MAKGFIKVPRNWIYAGMPYMAPLEQKVYLTLWALTFHKTGIAEAPEWWLADHFNVNEDSIGRALRELKRKGWIEIIPGKPNKYKLTDKHSTMVERELGPKRKTRQ